MEANHTPGMVEIITLSQRGCMPTLGMFGSYRAMRPMGVIVCPHRWRRGQPRLELRHFGKATTA